jgi:hypothetical protein
MAPLESFRAFDQCKYLGFLLLYLESERRAPCISCPSRAKILRFKNGVQLLIIAI